MKNRFYDKQEIYYEYSNFNYKKCIEYLFLSSNNGNI